MLSRSNIEIVENALAEESDLKPRREIVKEVSRLKEENKKMADDLRLKNIVLENYEKELKRYRSEPFLIDEFQGSRKYSKELITLLKQHETIDSHRILEALGIDPKEADQPACLQRSAPQLFTLLNFLFILRKRKKKPISDPCIFYILAIS